MDQAARGKKALAVSDYQTAIVEYTAALKASPTSPDYLIQRATAYHRAQDYVSALTDANNAVLNAQKRAKRELIVEAQFRRGCALYALDRYGDALYVFTVVKRMDEKHKMVPTWLQKTRMSLEKLQDGDEKGICRIKETPEADEASGAKPKQGEGSSTNGSGPVKPGVSMPQTAQPQTPADKIRHEWYQNSENVYFTLLAKGVPKDKAQIEIQERSLSISFPLVSGSSFDFNLDPLFGPVKPEKCIPRILPSKIEIILAKATAGQKWSALETNEPVTAPTTDSTVSATTENGKENDTVKRTSDNSSLATGPAYPTSSRTGPKNWDKIVKDVRTADNNGKEKSADDDDDYEGGDEANHFFQKLFKGSSPDVQKAMMKSYTESNGTSLSTNWEEVSKAKVETLPPDGMEAKSWS